MATCGGTMLAATFIAFRLAFAAAHEMADTMVTDDGRAHLVCAPQTEAAGLLFAHERER
jgi:hypothetical protein